MSPDKLEEANLIKTAQEGCEDFISNADWFIRQAKNEPNGVPVIDRWLQAAIRDSVITHAEIIALVTDLRDIVTTRLADLDKRLDAL